MTAREESNPLGKLIVGVLIGVGITYAYVRFGYKPPAVVQLAENVTDKAIVSTATISLYSPSATDLERKRALAVYLGKEPNVLLDIDRKLNGAIMTEVLRRKALKQAKVLKHQMSAYDAALSKPALRKVLETKHKETNSDRLKRKMLAAAIRQEEFLFWYLQRMSLDQTDEHFVDLVLGSYQNELRSDRMAATPLEGRMQR